jgi:SAM-dependent methyltransferase
LLFRLRGVGDAEDENGDDEEGEVKWTGKMLGVDYSEKSVEFANRIAADKGLGNSEIDFIHFDILTSSPSSILTSAQSSGWDVVLDKGTFDAISLSQEVDVRGRRICEGYREKVVGLMRIGGLFLVTSCNWTPEELRKWFEGEGEGGRLCVVGEIAYRSFRFGGEVGQTIGSVCFRRES